MAYLDDAGLEYFFGKLKEIFTPLLETQELSEKFDALLDTVATKSDLEDAITAIDSALSTAIGSGVLE